MVKSRIYVATRTALNAIRVDVGPCSKRIAATVRFPSSTMGTSLAGSPSSSQLLERWKLNTLGSKSLFLGPCSFSHFGNASALVGLTHTTRAMSSKPNAGNADASQSSAGQAGAGNAAAPQPSGDQKGTEPKTDFKAIIAKYGAVGAVVYFVISTILLLSTYALFVTLGMDTEYLLRQLDKAKAFVGMGSDPKDAEKESAPAEPNAVMRFFVDNFGLDPVVLAVAFTITTPLVPLEAAATVYIARRIVSAMERRAAAKVARK
ncbi:hypothetical protein DFJ74DRAFT_681310 [Hyaloraphidium curvatum]|nr:hypothetical protein DFJ74DRAFT_681310 [Hyaloraphidium curvatum]